MRNISGLIILTICFMIFSACSLPPKEASIADIVVERVNYGTHFEDKEYLAKLISSFTDSKDILSDIGFSNDVVEYYDDDYFKTKGIIIMVVESGISHQFMLKEIEITNEKMTVNLKKSIPPSVEDTLCKKGIVIEVDKEEVKNVTMVDVNIFE